MLFKKALTAFFWFKNNREANTVLNLKTEISQESLILPSIFVPLPKKVSI